MSRNKSNFLGAFGKGFEIFKSITDEVLARGGNDEDMERILKDKNLRKQIADLIVKIPSEIFHLTIDYGQSLAEMIAAGHYDWVNDDITAKNFPIQGSGVVEVDALLVHFNRNIGTDTTLTELDRMGYRPATLPELLAFGRQYPELQRQYPIIALGSVRRHPGGDRHVACLREDARSRYLDLRWSAFDWLDDCRFLAVRKSA